MSEWFLNVFGFNETEENVRKFIKTEETPDGVLLHDEANGKTFQSGIFKLISPNDFKHLKPRGGGKFNMIRGMGGRSVKKHLVDVLTAQSHPDNDGATFQAASNFNALEFTSCLQDSLDGITSYPYDRTQGPYCAVGCGASILYRNYFVEVPKNTKPGQYPHEINMLSETPIEVQHGYAQIGHTAKLEKAKFNWNDLSKYKVAAHINCEVTTTPQFEAFEGKQIVHHCYCAAFNLVSDVIENDFTLMITRKMLESQYRSTILQAWENSLRFPGRKGSNKCFLTLVGGGVFGNPHEIICDAIKACKDVIIASGLEVNLVCFSQYIYNTEYPYLHDLMKATGGTTIETNRED